MSFESDFLQGQRDCKEGVPQRRDNDDYLRGYAAQYEKEAVDDWATSEMGLEVDCGAK